MSHEFINAGNARRDTINVSIDSGNAKSRLNTASATSNYDGQAANSIASMLPFDSRGASIIGPKTTINGTDATRPSFINNSYNGQRSVALENSILADSGGALRTSIRNVINAGETERESIRNRVDCRTSEDELTFVLNHEIYNGQTAQSLIGLPLADGGSAFKESNNLIINSGHAGNNLGIKSIATIYDAQYTNSIASGTFTDAGTALNTFIRNFIDGGDAHLTQYS